jgi:hypothetical protein
MHYNLHLQLSVYEPQIISSEVIEGLIKELNKISAGKIKIRLDIENDGWDELEIYIQRKE